MSWDRWIDMLRLRLRSLVRGRALDREVDEELAFHLDHEMESRVRAGQSPAEARRDALVALGGVDARKEEMRDTRGLSALRDFGRDLGSGVRLLKRHPGFATLAIIVLALGIGVNTAMFTVINAVLLQPLRFPDADRLVSISVTPIDFDIINGGVLPAGLLALRDGDTLLSALAAFQNATASFAADAEPVQVGANAVTPNFFATLGITPALGRTFAPGDELASTGSVVVLSHELWQKQLGGRPDAVGTLVTVDGSRRRVVGVMPAALGPFAQGDLWVPMQIVSHSHSDAFYSVIARMRPAVSREQVGAEAEALVTKSLHDMGEDPVKWRAHVTPLKTLIVSNVQGTLLALAVAVALVLLIACSNVASLFLARTEERSKELAVRAAFGATRGRLIRQLFTEALLVSLLGGSLGVFATLGGVRLLTAVAGGTDLPLFAPIAVNAHVLLFTLATSVASAVIFGLAPAVVSRRATRDLTTHGRAITLRESRLHGPLIVTEIALCLVLLTGAGMMIRSIRTADPGFPTQHVGTVTIDLPGAHYGSLQAQQTFDAAVVSALAAVPAVRSATAVNHMPFGGNFMAGQFSLDTGNPWPDDDMAYNLCVGERYFDTLGIQVRRGRSFTAADRTGSRKVVIVSDAFARRFWPGEDALGRRISDADHPTDADWLTIVGIADDAKMTNLINDEPLAVYRPVAQASESSQLAHITFAVQTTSDPHDIGPAVRAIVRGLDPNLPVPPVLSMDELLTERLASPRFQARLLAAFALAALGITAVGIFGTLAYAVSRRTRELGVRIALGASGTQLVSAVVRRSLLLTLIGTLIGTAAAWGLTLILRDVLFGVTPASLSIAIAVTGLLMIVALAASAIPAIRASRVDAVVALRAE